MYTVRNLQMDIQIDAFAKCGAKCKLHLLKSSGRNYEALKSVYYRDHNVGMLTVYPLNNKILTKDLASKKGSFASMTCFSKINCNWQTFCRVIMH